MQNGSGRALKLTIVITVFVAAAVAVVLLQGDRDDAASAGKPAGGPDRLVESGGEPAKTYGEEEPGGFKGSAGGAGYSAAREALPPEGILVAGRVVDRRTAKPVTAFDMRITRLGRKYRETEIAHETIRDEDGRFSFRLQKGGYHDFEVGSARHLRLWKSIEISPETGRGDLLFELEPGAGIRGRVVDDATGLPIEGAVVGAARATYTDYGLERDLAEPYRFVVTSLTDILTGFDERTPHARTDREGRFFLGGQLALERTLYAVHPDYTAGTAQATPGEGGGGGFGVRLDKEIRLGRGHRVFGRARDDAGNPRPGLLILLDGEDSPVWRPVLTDRDGRYRTAPAIPGRVRVRATTLDNEPEGTPPFTMETKEGEIVDRDIEIDFGPDPGHITWCGTLRGIDEAPAAGGWVSAIRQRDDETDTVRISRSGYSGAEGRFELRKLLPGTYKVQVTPPGFHGRIDWGELVLAEPGVFESDISLLDLGGVIAGVVVDKATGAVPELGEIDWISVHAMNSAETWRGGYEAYMNDEDGTFCLWGLPEGSYYLIASSHEAHSETLIGVKVKEGAVTGGIRLEVELFGKLHLLMTGFTEADENAFGFQLKQKDGFEIPRDIVDEQNVTLPPGEWEARLYSEEIGSLVRPFTIERGKTTELSLSRGEVEPASRTVTVTGTLRRADGTPVLGAVLLFRSGSVGRNIATLETTTDSGGGFSLTGFTPRSWHARVDLESGKISLQLPGPEIPSNPPDTIEFDLVVPGGSVRGTLCDGRTGVPLAEDGLRWRAVVGKGIGFGRGVGTVTGDDGTLFEVEGIPVGRFILTVIAEGYRQYFSEPFPLADGQALELGMVMLEPCGILDIEAVDPAGEPVKHFWVYRGNAQLGGNTGCARSLAPGKRRFWELPTGPIELRVQATGYRNKEIEIHLEPGTPAELRVVLEPR